MIEDQFEMLNQINDRDLLAKFARTNTMRMHELTREEDRLSQINTTEPDRLIYIQKERNERRKLAAQILAKRNKLVTVSRAPDEYVASVRKANTENREKLIAEARRLEQELIAVAEQSFNIRLSLSKLERHPSAELLRFERAFGMAAEILRREVH